MRINVFIWESDPSTTHLPRAYLEFLAHVESLCWGRKADGDEIGSTEAEIYWALVMYDSDV